MYIEVANSIAILVQPDEGRMTVIVPAAVVRFQPKPELVSNERELLNLTA